MDDDDLSDARKSPEPPNPQDQPKAPSAPIPPAEPLALEAALVVVALIRELFGPALAAQVEAAASRIDRELSGRWDCLEAAVWTTTTVKRQPDRLYPYLLAGARRNLSHGIDPEAATIADAYHARARAPASAAPVEEFHRAPPPRPPDVDDDPTPLEERITLWRDMLASPSPGVRRVAAVNLAKHGIGPGPPPPGVGA